MWHSRIGWMVAVLFFLCACSHEKTTQLDIFYTADAEGFYHSRPEPHFANQDAGGYGVLKAFLARQEGPYLLLDGGNWLGSGPEAAITQGGYITRMMRDIPYTAASVSDKDFAFGWGALRNTLREMPYPFIVSNLKSNNQIPRPLHDYQIVTQKGIRIGIIGVIGPEVIQNHKNRLVGFSLQDPVESAVEMSALMQSKGVDLIILLNSWAGEEKASPAAVRLAEEAGEINLILSSNKGRETPETDKINKTYIVYPGSKLDSIAHIRVWFDKNKQIKDISFTDVPLLKNSWGEDETIAAESQRLQQETQRKLSSRVSTAPQELETSLSAESVLGDLLTDCLYKWSKLDGAILNADSIRSSLPEGVVTEYDLHKMYPYGDNITFLTMRGSSFLKALEASMDVKDNFPQIAGFTVSYRSQAPTGKKISQVVLNNGRIIRPQETYRFAVTDHVLAGGFGHDYFIDSLEFKNTFVDARQIMRACLVRQKTIALPKTGRWKQVQ
ncbi:MAG: bifunctional metallophosphatase/5'-nucleotidase [Elusimicrobiaceae bacterium]|nr:bifunctional metallophosphatase/5'-nucleotidase [Elusimicrobiaceae bacterium]